MQSSSIFNFNTQSNTVMKLAAAATVGLWIGYFTLAGLLSTALARLVGSLITDKTRGLVPDPTLFFRQVLFESVVLLTTVLILVVIASYAPMLCRKYRIEGFYRYTLVSVLIFASVNVFVGMAANTTLYWLGSYLAYPNLKQSFFNTNLTLLENAKTPKTVAIVGSSQGQSQFDAGIMNQAFYPETQFANLSYPGAKAWDFNLLFGKYQRLQPDVIVVYVSVMNFYDKTSGSSRIIPLVTASSLPEIIQYQKDGFIDQQDLIHGLISLALPLYQSRRNIELALLGPLAEKGFAIQRARAHTPLAEPKRHYADRFLISELSDYQKLSFQSFVARNLDAGFKVVVVKGQVSPKLEKRLQPGILEDYEQFIDDTKAQFPTARILDESVPRHVTAVYDDFMHINNTERASFTKSIIKLIKNEIN